MRLIVITSCTSKKAVESPNSLSIEDFKDPKRLQKAEEPLRLLLRRAAEMYTGLQHLRVMDGVTALRTRFGESATEVWIVSAGYGLIPEHRLIAPYKVTFKKMRSSDLIAWSRQLRIPLRVREMIRSAPLVMFLLGDHYLKAIEPPVQPEAGQRLVFLAKPSWEGVLRGKGVTVVPSGETLRSEFNAGSIEAKGIVFQFYARALAQEGEPLWQATCADDTPTTFLNAARRGRGL
jgi:hypothetical protein